MSLESTLAKIEVLSDEIIDRNRRGKAGRAGFYASGVAHEAKSVEEAARKTASVVPSFVRKVKVDEIEKDASRYVGDLVLASKNLGDNLSRLIQEIYSPKNEEPDLKLLFTLDSRTPTLADGKSIVHRLLSTHQRSGEVIGLRNRQGHGYGHALVHYEDGDFRINSGSANVPAAQWVQMQAENYLNTAREILSAISETEKDVLAPRKGRKSVFIQRIKHWKNRHKAIAIAGLSSALVASGAIGAYANQKISERDQVIAEGAQIRELIKCAAITRSAIWAYDEERRECINLLKNIAERNKNIGSEVDTYLGNIQIVTGHKLRKGVQNEYNDFNRFRRYFAQKIHSTMQAVEERRDTIQNIQDISDILANERELRKDESKLLDTISRNKPYFSGMIDDSWRDDK